MQRSGALGVATVRVRRKLRRHQFDARNVDAMVGQQGEASGKAVLGGPLDLALPHLCSRLHRCAETQFPWAGTGAGQTVSEQQRQVFVVGPEHPVVEGLRILSLGCATIRVMDAVIYARVSSDQNNGRSVADQEAECRAECERNGWPVRAVYVDNDISASRYGRKRREAWEKLKADLRQGDILVCWEASRAGRGLADHLELRDLLSGLDVPVSYGGRMLDLNEGDDRFTAGLDALLSERESEKIRDRILRGKRASAASGRPSGPPPWGYQVTGRAEWGPDPVEAPRVLAAAEKLLAGESVYSVRQWLGETGYAPSGTDLARMICNPALAGLRVYKGEVVGKGTWPAIITEEQHRTLVRHTRRLRTQNGYVASPGPQPKHLLSGIAVCGVCEATLRHTNAASRGAPAYCCSRGHVWKNAAKLDKLVLGELFRIVEETDPADWDKSDDTDADAAQDEIDQIQEQLDDYEAQAIAGQITAVRFARIEQGLQARIDEITPRTIVKGKYPLNYHELRRRWEWLDITERRERVRDYVTITVNPAAGRRSTDEDITVTPRV